MKIKAIVVTAVCTAAWGFLPVQAAPEHRPKAAPDTAKFTSRQDSIHYARIRHIQDSINAAMDDSVARAESIAAQESYLQDVEVTDDAPRTSPWLWIIALGGLCSGAAALWLGSRKTQDPAIGKLEGKYRSLLTREQTEEGKWRSELSAQAREIETLRARVDKLSADLAAFTAPPQTSSRAARTPVQPKPSPASAQSEIVFYVDTLCENGNGDLSIPMQTLRESNNGEAFRVTVAPDLSSGRYDLNPRMSNMTGNLDTIRRFSTGFDDLSARSATTLAAGTLVKDGYDLKVTSKLVVRTEK